MDRTNEQRRSKHDKSVAEDRRIDVAIVGAGPSGLACANALRTSHPSLLIRVFDASERPGGWIGSRSVETEFGSFCVEHGADSILAAKPWVINYFRSLGLEGRLVRTRPENRGALILSQGKLHPIPQGFQILAPSDSISFLRSPLVSPLGKLRALMEPWRPQRPEGAPLDESLGGFVERRLGREILEKLAEPLAAGIYGGDPYAIGLAATFPRFLKYEREFGSVIAGIRNEQRRANALSGSADASASTSGARYGLFVAFDRGMQVLVDRLSEGLGDVLTLNTEVKSVAHRGDMFAVATNHGEWLASEVVLATSPKRSAGLLVDSEDSDLRERLSDVDQGSVATISMAFHREQFSHAFRSYGLLVPYSEQEAVLAATFASEKWPGRAPDDFVLIRLFLGDRRANPCLRSDREIEVLALDFLRRHLGLDPRGGPLFSLVSRFADAMPRLAVGHIDNSQAIEALAAKAGLHIAGHGVSGVGIPDTLERAIKVADAVHRRFASSH